MLCSKCNQRQANIFYSQNVNGESQEYNLCESCAKEMGIFGGDADLFSFGDAFSPIDFLSTLLGEAVQPKRNVQETIPKCSYCGMTYPEFTKVGRFGCANCYDAFGELLPPVLKKIHGNCEHVGKAPKKEAKASGKRHELEDLKNELKSAIDREEYEKAAELRDMIRKMELEN